MIYESYSKNEGKTTVQGQRDELQIEWGLSDKQWEKEVSYLKTQRILERRQAQGLGEQRHSEREQNKAKNKARLNKGRR